MDERSKRTGISPLTIGKAITGTGGGEEGIGEGCQLELYCLVFCDHFCHLQKLIYVVLDLSIGLVMECLKEAELEGCNAVLTFSHFVSDLVWEGSLAAIPHVGISEHTDIWYTRVYRNSDSDLQMKHCQRCGSTAMALGFWLGVLEPIVGNSTD